VLEPELAGIYGGNSTKKAVLKSVSASGRVSSSKHFRGNV
jgi:hypothetical protein